MQDRLRAQAPQSPPRTASPPRAPSRLRTLRLLGGVCRGILMGGAGFLLGSCPLLFGAAPLGLALLAASSAYTWYILGGLLLSAAFTPVTLSGWAWVSVYLLCIILRLAIRFFVDPPSLSDGRPCSGRLYLLLCWDSFKRNAGLGDKPSPQGDTVTDYYAGADTLHDPRGRQASPSESTADGCAAPPVRDFHPHLFLEHPFLRLLTAAACGFMAGIFGIVAGRFHVYDLLTALCLLILTPVAAFLLISCFGEAGLTLLFAPDPLGRDAPTAPQNDPLHKQFHALPITSVCFLITATVYAARGFSLPLWSPALSLSAAVLLGLVVTLFAVTRLGVTPGTAVAVLCGLAAEPLLSPSFILCALVCGLLGFLSHRAGVLGGITAAIAVCWITGTVELLLLHTPSMLLAAPVFLAAESLWQKLPVEHRAHREEEELRDTAALFSSMLALESRRDAQRQRMKALSEAFESLSRRFYDLSSRLKRPRLLDLRRICDESFTARCAHCRNRDICWGAEYDRTLETQARLASQLHTGGRADVASLPDSLQNFCPYMEDMVRDINSRCARMTEILLRSEKTEVFAADYAAIAALLEDALEEDRRAEEDFACNRKAADEIYDYLTREGVAVQGVVVGGKRQSLRRRVIVRGEGFQAVADRLPEIRAVMEEICGMKLTAPVMESDGGDGTASVMTLCSEARLDTVFSGSTVPAGRSPEEPLPPPLTTDTPVDGYEPPAVCGDHIAMFRTDNAYFYALISDGMGSGEDASMTSDVCAMFLEKMLSAGNRVEVSLKMLDSVIRSKNTGTGDECSATVDLMELDLMDGHALFSKNGAAPTYVVREGIVYKLHSPALPIGILPDTPSRLLRFRMHPGDVVVMVSDGVTLGNDECPWLIDLLSSPMPDSMDSLRRDIIKRALTAGSEDDLSAIAIRVEER